MIRVRAEENAVLIWDKKTAGTAYVSGAELRALEIWAGTGMESGFIKRLKRYGLVSETAKADFLFAINESRLRKAPLRSFCAPESLHIELTTRCSLRCPQCYKGIGEIADLPLDTLRDIIVQADEMKIFQIALGGGEPLLYPYLMEAVEEIARREMSCSITTSGTGVDKETLAGLGRAGLNHVQVSLNGSTAEIHSRSRDGFANGIQALKLLAGSGLSYGVNWVARMDNVDDLPQMIALAQEMRARNINILRYKPSAAEDYDKLKLSEGKIQFMMDAIRGTKGIVAKVDSAFSNLLCMLNGRPGAFGGCGAGRRFIVLDAQGRFRPCSHVNFAEPAQNLMAYWTQSAHLAMFREAEERLSAPCSQCAFLDGCRGCRAIAMRKQCFYAGDEECCVM